jgi:hypothetical protein
VFRIQVTANGGTRGFKFKLKTERARRKRKTLAKKNGDFETLVKQNGDFLKTILDEKKLGIT